MQDALIALQAHLLTIEAITDLVVARIWGGEIPEKQIRDMPRACIVLRYTGGLVTFRTLRAHEPRVDILSYGDGYLQASQVDGAVADALIAIRRVDISDTLIHSVAFGGPSYMKERETGWRYVHRSAIVKAGETTTA